MRRLIAAILVSFAALACIPAARAQSLTSEELKIYKEIVHRSYLIQQNQNQSPFDQDFYKISADVASGYNISSATAQDIFKRGLEKPVTKEEQELEDRLTEKYKTLPKDMPWQDIDRACEPIFAEYGKTSEDVYEMELRMMKDYHWVW